MKPRLLDLFCGAGGAAMGYHRAGFEVVGVDINSQPHYPFEFHRLDAMELLAPGTLRGWNWYGLGFDAVHASPPCQAYSISTPVAHRGNHPRLIPTVRAGLLRTGIPFAIENVENARVEMVSPVVLCGSMFGLPLWRHRYFEVWPEALLMSPASCNHEHVPVLVGGSSTNAGKLGPIAPTGTTRRASGRFEWSAAESRIAMGIDWMTRKELDEAIPPAYTEWIGRQLLQVIERGAVA